MSASDNLSKKCSGLLLRSSFAILAARARHLFSAVPMPAFSVASRPSNSSDIMSSRHLLTSGLPPSCNKHCATLFIPHVAAYLAGRVHRALPPHEGRHTAVRRPVDSRNQARWLPHHCPQGRSASAALQPPRQRPHSPLSADR